MHIITHRGLDPTKESYFAESSLEAFSDQLERGYGIEFDLQVTKDDKVVVIHDRDLTRISNGTDKRKISEMNESEITTINFEGSHITSFDKILALINEKQSPNSISAIHLKYQNQNKETLDTVLGYLEDVDPSKFLIFDTTIEAAIYLKSNNNTLNLAPSVADAFDIERYNQITGGTLLSVDTVLANANLFTWVWLDEWDRKHKNNTFKEFYTKETFHAFKAKGLKIALVTPELHGTSPGLLGGESHQDALDKTVLFDRIKRILDLGPDAICTDYPDEVKIYGDNKA